MNRIIRSLKLGYLFHAKMPDSDWVVIGISGVTCGGKTTLANQLRDTLVQSYVFHQDKYFYPDDSPRHVRCEGMDHNNYDILSALNMDLLYKDILETMEGHDKSHSSNKERVPGMFEARDKKFLIVEGFTALNYKPIMEICTLRYYFVLTFEDCAVRRCFRLYDPPDVEGYFDRCVWPEHLKYKAEIQKDRRVTFLDGMRQDAVDIVLKDLKNHGVEQIV